MNSAKRPRQYADASDVESSADRATSPPPAYHALLRDSRRHTEAAIEILE